MEKTMGNKSRKIGVNIVDLICCGLVLAALVFVIHKCQAPLSYASEQLTWQEPTWKTGTSQNGTAAASGEVRRTRLFFKAQDVILEYDVNGVTYTCENRMLKKEYDKLPDAGEAGKKSVSVRYDPGDPSRAATEKTYDLFKKDKYCYLGVKWLSIMYLVYYGILLYC